MHMTMSKRDVIATQGELSTPGGKAPSKKRKAIAAVLRSLLMLVFALVIAASAQITYDYARYQKFFVNGESMYPSLNRDAERYDEAGNRVESPVYLLGDFSSPGTYICDYGISDCSASFRERLKRYSVVVTYFDEDMVYDAASASYVPRSGSGSEPDLKIKRIIGLPGETVYFSSAGDLFVKGAGTDAYELIGQPFFEKQSDWTAEMMAWADLAKPASAKGSFATESNPCVLGADEYFLCGDNRLASTDSRMKGPVHGYSFVGKAIAITAKCSYRVPSSGASGGSCEPIWSSFRMPWDLAYLSEYE
jgi:signal peptidase I